VIDLPTGDVYTALQNGVVDATGWTQIGLIDLRWNEFLNYRIEPCFFSTDLGVIVNLETWNSLTPEAQEILQTSPSSTRSTA
jgi:TRAP-type C4-dicarboxylate transport system substrate-binding protein